MPAPLAAMLPAVEMAFPSHRSGNVLAGGASGSIPAGPECRSSVGASGKEDDCGAAASGRMGGCRASATPPPFYNLIRQPGTFCVFYLRNLFHYRLNRLTKTLALYYYSESLEEVREVSL